MLVSPLIVEFQAILTMCDIQIFTGIGVLSSGFVLLSRGIQTYHWLLIVYIAWFSSITHLSAMTVLRSYFRERRVETSIRFGLMSCLLIMLLIAFIPTAWFDWTNPFFDFCTAAWASSPAICFFDFANARKLSAGLDQDWCGAPPSNSAGQVMLMSLVLLIFGFVSRSIKIFEVLSTTLHVYFRRPISKWAQQVLACLSGPPKTETVLGSTRNESSSGHHSCLMVLRHPCAAVFLSFRITTDLIGSMLAEVRSSHRTVSVFLGGLTVHNRRTQIYWLMVLVGWGTTKLLVTRAIVRLDANNDENDAYNDQHDANNDQHDAWTFGQILPVLLLVAPIWSLVTTFAFSDRSERLRRLSRTQQNPLTAVSATQISSPRGFVANSTTAGAVDSRSIGETRYISCYWIGPCLAFACLLVIAVTVMQFIYVSVAYIALTEFWVDQWGVIYVLVLVYPFGLHCSILIGLIHEEGILGDRSAPSRSKTYQVRLWLTIFIVWVFFIAMWVFSITGIGISPNIRYEGILGGTVILHLVYALGYFFQASRNRTG